MANMRRLTMISLDLIRKEVEGLNENEELALQARIEELATAIWNVASENRIQLNEPQKSE